MSVALVGSAGAVTSVTGTNTNVTLAPSFAQATTAGNLLIALVYRVSTPITVSDPSWTRAVTDAGGDTDIWYKADCGAGETAPSWSCQISGTATLYGMFMEFSGAATVSPLDQTQTAFTTASNPFTTTAPNPDATIGLLLGVGSDHLTMSATTTTTVSLNNATAVSAGNNDSTSTARHFRFAYGLATANAVADTFTYNDTGKNWLETGMSFASFKAAAASSLFDGQQGSLRDDPNSLQVIGQAVKRGAYYMRRWQRRDSGLLVPA